MICPICREKCSEHWNELGQWFDCPNHGFVKLVRYEENSELAQVQRHDEYVDAVGRSLEASTGG
jgi:hypothetical protein